jgi:hypothetical protein
MVRQDTLIPKAGMQNYDAAGVITAMLHAIDAKDWPGVRAALADQVDVDYSSLSGAPAARVAADELVAGWQRALDAFDVTQHMTGPILVTANPDSLTAQTHVRAFHRRSGQIDASIWLVAGHYDLRLAQFNTAWKITAMTLRVFYQEGAAT